MAALATAGQERVAASQVRGYRAVVPMRGRLGSPIPSRFHDQGGGSEELTKLSDALRAPSGGLRIFSPLVVPRLCCSSPGGPMLAEHAEVVPRPVWLLLS